MAIIGVTEYKTKKNDTKRYSSRTSKILFSSILFFSLFFSSFLYFVFCGETRMSRIPENNIQQPLEKTLLQEKLCQCHGPLINFLFVCFFIEYIKKLNFIGIDLKNKKMRRSNECIKVFLPHTHKLMIYMSKKRTKHSSRSLSNITQFFWKTFTTFAVIFIGIQKLKSFRKNCGIFQKGGCCHFKVN